MMIHIAYRHMNSRRVMSDGTGTSIMEANNEWYTHIRMVVRYMTDTMMTCMYRQMGTCECMSVTVDDEGVI